MKNIISKSIIKDLTGYPIGDDIVPFIDNVMRQFSEKMSIPMLSREHCKLDKDETKLYFTDFYEERNSFFYDLTCQTEKSLITLIEMILSKKLDNFRQYLTVVHFYNQINYGINYQGCNSLSVEIRSENGYIKVSVYDDSENCQNDILLKVEENKIFLNLYGSIFKMDLADLDQFDIQFENFIDVRYNQKVKDIINCIGFSNMTSKHIVERSKMSIYEAMQTTTKQLNIKNIEQLHNDFKLNEPIIKHYNNICYTTKKSNEILILTNAILKPKDAFLIRQIISFSQFRKCISNRTSLIYSLKFNGGSKYRENYSTIYNFSIFTEDDTRVIGDISIDFGNYKNSALLLDFFKAKEHYSDSPKTIMALLTEDIFFDQPKYLIETPEDFFQIMKNSFKQEIFDALDLSTSDLVTEHYKLYEIFNC